MLLARDPIRGLGKSLRCAAILLLVLTLLPSLAQAAEQALLLDVQVNGRSIGKVGEFTLRDSKLMARREELHDLGLQVPVSGGPESDGLIDLSTLPGLTWRLDQATQTVYITVPNNRLLATVLQINEGSAGHRAIESGTGATLNYDISSTLAGGKIGSNGSLDLRVFSPWGVASSDWLAYAGATPGGSGTNASIRLDSAYSFADVNTLRRYGLGDFITGGLAWTRPVRLVGAQVRSDFSMRPDLVTFPMPSISGSAAVPSTIDLLVNGDSVLSHQVDAGPFEIPQLPVITGAGTISMTVTNALGQQVNVTQPFYASASLLAPGLQTFSAQAGAVRRNWGVDSNDYGKLAAVANYRRGLTSKLTVEGSAEGAPGTVMAGGGGVVNVHNLGVLNFAAAASSGSGYSGTQFSAGVQRIGRVFSLGGSATIASGHFQDVAAINGDTVPRQQFNGNGGLSLRRFGSLGVAYARLDQDASPVIAQYAVPAQHSRVVSASYSLQIRRASIYATEFRDLVNQNNGGLQAGLTIPFGKRGSVGVGGASDGSVQVQAQLSAATIGDWGYQAYISGGDTVHEFAQAQYKAHSALLTAGVDSSASQTTLRMESQGSLSVVDRGLFPSNTIYDSFAIVDTSGLGHIHVTEENRDVGRTNSGGRLLVPDLRSFDLNRIAIEPTDVPLDATISFIDREVRPQDRSGVVVRFPVKISHAALLRLVDAAGLPMPVGSTATLRATGVAAPVGFDGEAYVQDLGVHNDIAVESPDGLRCSVAFNYKPVPGDIPTIGPLRCVEPGI